MSESIEEGPRDSFLYHNEEQTGILKWLQKFDYFSFIPIPKDQPVSTKRSIIGSTIFILLFFVYVGVDLYQFIAENPPLIEDALTQLDEEVYHLPRTAITFMDGQYLETPIITQKIFKWNATIEVKGNARKQETVIKLGLNRAQNLSDWLNAGTLNFYHKLYSPVSQFKAQGLLYSTDNATYSKLSINMCDYFKKPTQCQTEQNITSQLAKGRVFLFIEEMQDETGISKRTSSGAKFRIANFFLIPQMYKRVIVEYKVIKTTVLPDYFHYFTTREFTKLQIQSITEQTSDVKANVNQTRGQVALNLLGINFQLAAQSLNVKVTYITLLDHVSKWGAFFNVLFGIFAIYFLAYNQNKYYKKNPEWAKFGKNKRRNQYTNVSEEVKNPQ